MRKILFITSFLLVALAGCTENEATYNNAEAAELSTSVLNFENNYEGTKTLVITSSVPWTAQTTQAWCLLSDYSGTGNCRLKVSVKNNLDSKSRIAAIIIKSAGVPDQTVKIEQLGQEEQILLSVSAAEIGYLGTNVMVDVVTNVPQLVINVPQEADWIAQSGSEAKPTGGTAVTFAAARNNSIESRTAAITFSGGNAKQQTFSVVQGAITEPVIRIDNANMDETAGLRARAFKLKFKVESNVEYELLLPSWIQQSNETNGDNYVLAVAENTGARRNGKVVVKQVGADMADTLDVMQLAPGEVWDGSRLTDSLALVGIYNDLGMVYWTTKDNKNRAWAFDLKKPMSQWRAIELNAAGRVERFEVLGYLMPDQSMRFRFATNDLEDLTKLKVLKFNTPHISEIPAIANTLANLDTLTIVGDLAGSIPDLSGLQQLRYLRLGGDALSSWNTQESGIGNRTRITGSFPAFLQQMTNLTRLYLGHNRLSGEIPSWIGYLTNLEVLSLPYNAAQNDISDAGFSGEIPVSIGNMSALRGLYLYNNTLSGSLPASLGNLTEIVDIWLYNNRLSGNIPDIFTNLTKLNTVVLANNQLSGTIPSSIDAVIDNMEAFVVTMNQLEGTVPAKLLERAKNNPADFDLCNQNGKSYTNYTCN